MMQMPRQLQNLFIIGVVVIAAFIAYSYFFTGKEEPVLSQTPVAGGSAVDQDLITLLLQLKAITLDDRIFTDPAFTGLQDFGQELIPEPIGRMNPFAPLQNK